VQQLTQLKTTPLGGTGLEITRVRLGACAIGGSPAVDRAIIGFRRPDQVDAVLDAAHLELTDADLADIEDTNRPAMTQ
jgi:aryl-alcohol dehydrogenase-like predicted oxidoreductase